MSSISGYSSNSYNSYTQSSIRQKPSEEEMAAMKQAMFSKADSSGDGTIDKTELADFLSKGPGGSSNSSNIDDTFSKFDSNGDGSISQDEMDAGMKSLHSQMESNMNKIKFGGSAESRQSGGMGKPPSIEDLFSKADSSSDGSISSTEFSDFISKGPQADSVNAQKAFAKYDSNGDDSLSSDEFKAGMKDLMSSMPPPPPPPGSDSASSNSNSSSSSNSSDAFSSLDANGDGVVDANEFSKMSGSQIKQIISAYIQQMSSSYSSQTSSQLSSLSA